MTCFQTLRSHQQGSSKCHTNITTVQLESPHGFLSHIFTFKPSISDVTLEVGSSNTGIMLRLSPLSDLSANEKMMDSKNLEGHRAIFKVKSHVC